MMAGRAGTRTVGGEWGRGGEAAPLILDSRCLLLWLRAEHTPTTTTNNNNCHSLNPSSVVVHLVCVFFGGVCACCFSGRGRRPRLRSVRVTGMGPLKSLAFSIACMHKRLTFYAFARGSRYMVHPGRLKLATAPDKGDLFVPFSERGTLAYRQSVIQVSAKGLLRQHGGGAFYSLLAQRAPKRRQGACALWHSMSSVLLLHSTCTL